VEAAGVQAAEVADAGDSQADEPVEELPHAVAAQRDPRADGVALAELEAGDRLLGPGDHGLLAGDPLEVADGAVEEAGLRQRATDAHVDGDLREAGGLHR